MRLLCAALIATSSVACTSDGSVDFGPPQQNLDAATKPDSASDRSGTKIPCGDRQCTAPAICVASVSTAICRCPLGYIDVHGDGSLCTDINECIIPNICDLNGTCTNVPGGYECKCAEPMLVALGNHCVCGAGYTRSSDGRCLAHDGKGCGSDQDCLNHHCEGGTCCAVQCDHPNVCHTSDAATCDDGKTCSYPQVPDGTACDDARACTARSVCKAGKCGGGQPLRCDDKNPCTEDRCEEPYGCRNVNNQDHCDDGDPCTQGDTCHAGLCSGDPKSCAAASDSCNSATCDSDSGRCVQTSLPDGTACDDGDSCSVGDHCAAGSCSAGQTACGPHATACMPTEMGNQCACADGFVNKGSGGRCVPTSDECASQSRCAADANCEDPSNNTGDFVCTCKPGFTGDGVTCTAADPCQNNPCGADRGTCHSSAPGTYSCQCKPGYVARGSSCECDMSGTFAVRSRIELAWSRLSDLIEPGSDAVNGYAIERFSYDPDGKLQLEHIACGDGAFDLCGLGAAPTLAAEAYSQYIPAPVWDLPSMPKVKTQVHDSQYVPGSPFGTGNVAHLHGIDLADPLGAWPKSRRDIMGTPAFDGTAVNGAMWLDQDDDGFVGLTDYVVPPGGVTTDAAAPTPPRNYGANSPVCPRSGGPHTPYAYWPASPEGPTGVPVRVKRFYIASRVVSAYKGTIKSCDEISGDILGADGKPVQLDVRIGGCIREHGSDETACPDSAVDFLDGAAQSQAVMRATFLLKRWPAHADVSCAAARAFPFD